MIPDLSAALCRYAALRHNTAHHHGHEKGTVRHPFYTVLDRYAAVWNSPSPLEPSGWRPSSRSVQSLEKLPRPTAGVRLRYHSFIAPAGPGPWDHVRCLAALPFMARLNYVKQLSTTSISLNIEATHNRLAHLLGTMDMCATLLVNATLTAADDALPHPTEVVGILFLALIHDAYHGPFGHSLDRIADIVLENRGTVRIDKALLTESIAQAKEHRGRLWELLLLLAHWCWKEDPTSWSVRTAREPHRYHNAEEFADAVLGFLVDCGTATAMAKRRAGRFWLRELLDSTIDADRLDYLLRDTHALWYRTAMKREIVDALIKGARVLSSEIKLTDLNPQGAPVSVTKAVNRVHWDEHHSFVVDELRALRAELYARAYEAPEKRSLDEMLVHGLVWVLRDQFGDGAASREQLATLLKYLVAVTDDELFHFLYEIGTAEQNRLSLALVHDVAVGRPFPEVWQCGIPVHLLKDVAGYAEALGDRWTRARDELVRAIARTTNRLIDEVDREEIEIDLLLRTYRQQVEFFGDELAASTGAREQLQVESIWSILLYLLCRYFGRSFVRREQLERLLWDALVVAEGNKRLADVIIGEAAAIYLGTRWRCSDPGPNRSEEFIPMARERPLLFLSVPWVSAQAADAELAAWSPEEAPLYHRSGKVVTLELDLPLALKQRFYPVSVYLPLTLARHKQVRDLVGRLVRRLIYSLVWIAPTQASSAGIEWWDETFPQELDGFGSVIEDIG